MVPMRPISRPPQPARCGLDRGPYPRIGAAAAEIGAHDIVNIGVGRIRIEGQQRPGRHALAGLAIAALCDLVLDPSGLNRMQRARLAQSLDRRYLARYFSYRNRTGASRHALDMHGARTTLGNATAV